MISLIAVDIGNSTTKIGWFDTAASQLADQNALPPPLDTFSFVTGNEPPESLLAKLPAEHCRWAIVSVNREGTRLLTAWIARHRPADDVRQLGTANLPIKIAVDFPERVGLDRLAAAVAASALREPGRPMIVIGAGSAITVNLIAYDGAFAGGAILPGFRMAAEALYGGADLLPLADLAPNDEPPPFTGRNTEAAIRSGLFWGAVGGVREIVAGMAAQLDARPQVIVTGGDLRQFARYLGSEARFVPHLVLSGIAIAQEFSARGAEAK